MISKSSASTRAELKRKTFEISQATNSYQRQLFDFLIWVRIGSKKTLYYLWTIGKTIVVTVE